MSPGLRPGRRPPAAADYRPITGANPLPGQRRIEPLLKL